MKTIKLLGVVAIIGTTILSTPSCGKYEEGPGFTLLTKKMRLTNDWDVKEVVYSDGTVVADNDDQYTTFEKDGTAKAIDGNLIVTGTWEFSSDKEKLRVTYTYFGQPDTDEFTIIRLTNKELWLKDINNDLYKAEAK